MCHRTYEDYACTSAIPDGTLKAVTPRRSRLRRGGDERPLFNLSRVFRSSSVQTEAPKPASSAPLGPWFMGSFGEAASAIEPRGFMLVSADLYAAERQRNEEQDRRYFLDAIGLMELQRAFAGIAKISRRVHSILSIVGHFSFAA